MNTVMESITSYIVALGAMLLSNSDTIMAVAGGVLITIRLINDGANLYRNIRKWLGK